MQTYADDAGLLFMTVVQALNQRLAARDRRNSSPR